MGSMTENQTTLTDRAKWWTEDRRGNLMGHGIKWGNKWAHLTRVVDDGPGANGITALCHGIQSVMRVNSGLDLDNQAECEQWKQWSVDVPLGALLEDNLSHRSLNKICPKCRAAYARHLARDFNV
jgi:hypothetical protein